MGFDDRDYAQHERKGLPEFLSRVLDNPANPTGWSVKLFALMGVQVRVHLVFPLLLLVFAVRAFQPDTPGHTWTWIALGALVLLVVLQELAHTIVCRLTGGEATRIVLVPWGGLNLRHPPEGEYKAHLLTALAGPLLHAGVFIATTAALAIAGRTGTVFFDLFDWQGVLVQSGSLAIDALWLFHAVNLTLLLITLLPSAPMDGGDAVVAAMSPKISYANAVQALWVLGFVVAGVLALYGLAENSAVLIAVAALCGIASEQRRRTSSFRVVPGEDDDALFAPPGAARDDHNAVAERVRRAQEKREHAQAQLDALLDKIAQGGMDALSAKERKRLESLRKELSR